MGVSQCVSVCGCLGVCVIMCVRAYVLLFDYLINDVDVIMYNLINLTQIRFHKRLIKSERPIKIDIFRLHTK